MVLWEITLGTAYFLGLKRTYKLALKIQRKLIRPKHRKIREFLQRRTRNVFDVALRVHLAIQERDIEVGRNLGNRILRWLDRMKPEAQIRKPIAPTDNMKKQQSHQNHLSKHNAKSRDGESNRHLFSVARNVWPKPFTTMMRPTGNSIQHRRYYSGGFQLFTVNNTKFGFGEVLRSDIKQWILHQ
ncbi:hypothetical protein ACS0TY_011102 [Phlomoides rotata]